jgi:hypothetical protein
MTTSTSFKVPRQGRIDGVARKYVTPDGVTVPESGVHRTYRAILDDITGRKPRKVGLEEKARADALLAAALDLSLDRDRFPTATRAAAASLYEAGEASQAVADRAGVSAATVLNWLPSQGVAARGRRVSKTARTAAVRAYRSGLTADEVGAQFGVTGQAVLNWVRAAGYTPRPKGHRPSR